MYRIIPSLKGLSTIIRTNFHEPSALKESRLLDRIKAVQMKTTDTKMGYRSCKTNQNKMSEETGIKYSLTEEDRKLAFIWEQE